MLKIGSHGEAVALLQNNLRILGFFVRVDGIFGEYTEQAVIDFQYLWNSQGTGEDELILDGVVGDETVAALVVATELKSCGRWNVWVGNSALLLTKPKRMLRV